LSDDVIFSDFLDDVITWDFPDDVITCDFPDDVTARVLPCEVTTSSSDVVAKLHDATAGVLAATALTRERGEPWEA